MSTSRARADPLAKARERASSCLVSHPPREAGSSLERRRLPISTRGTWGRISSLLPCRPRSRRRGGRQSALPSAARETAERRPPRFGARSRHSLRAGWAFDDQSSAPPNADVFLFRRQVIITHRISDPSYYRIASLKRLRRLRFPAFSDQIRWSEPFEAHWLPGPSEGPDAHERGYRVVLIGPTPIASRRG